MKDLERTLKALANKKRLAILKYLKKSGRASVADIADAIDLSFKATSKHLGILFAADILEKEKISLQIFYYLSPVQKPAAKQVIDIL